MNATIHHYLFESAGSGFWLAQGDKLPALLGAVFLGITAIGILVWVCRVRAWRRFHRAVDAFALQEIELERCRLECQAGAGVSSAEGRGRAGHCHVLEPRAG